MYYLIMYSILNFFYIKIAKFYKIYDSPNNRSSHLNKTITGGGIIFPIAFLLPIIINQSYDNYKYISLGLIFLSIISFIDDIKNINNYLRLFIHSIAVILIFHQMSIVDFNLIYLIIFFVFITGIINSYNFMDGINGLNGLYSLSFFATIFFINKYYFSIIDEYIIVSVLISISIFLFYNFRNKAIYFSGDVGSITISYIISFIILFLIILDNNIKWILLLGIYGLDSLGTIVLRLIRGENILTAHRSHLYQYLYNEKKISALIISIIYSALQIAINYMIIYYSEIFYIIFYIIIISFYIIIRLKFEGFSRLFVKY